MLKYVHILALFQGVYMYKFSNNVCIRKCKELIFFIDKKSNSIFIIQDKAYEYLLDFIKKKITLSNCNNEKFVSFFNNLIKLNILLEV